MRNQPRDQPTEPGNTTVHFGSAPKVGNEAYPAVLPCATGAGRREIRRNYRLALQPILPSLLTGSTTKMDIVDRDIERAEFEATRTWSQSSKERHEAQRRTSQESTGSSSTSSSESLDMNRTATASGASIPSVARTRTAGGHPIELHRTQTHALQQTHTVGASLRSKKTEKPLPEFGGGKPYPPPLPAQEE